MANIGLFQCDPWCLPTQNWLKNATNDISIQEFHNVTRHYVKDTDSCPLAQTFYFITPKRSHVPNILMASVYQVVYVETQINLGPSGQY
jgi:hypothetical protein